MSTKPETRKKLSITIDDKRYTTRDDDQECASLLRLAGLDPDVYDLAKKKRNGAIHVYRDGIVIDLEDGDEFVSVIFGVDVNGTFVKLDKRKQTAHSVKQAAIAAGVPIGLDFVLSEVRDNGEQQIIADDEHIKVKYHDAFWAVPGDDNS
jgi:hypothetical protein